MSAKEIKKAIVLTYFFYTQKEMDDSALALYLNSLMGHGLTERQLVWALEKHRLDPQARFFPKPAELIAILKPMETEEDLARDAAARVMGSVSRFGYTNPEEARQYIGELGWEAVLRMFGSWQNLCQNLMPKEVPSIQAQLRDLCKSILKAKTVSSARSEIESHGESQNLLEGNVTKAYQKMAADLPFPKMPEFPKDD